MPPHHLIRFDDEGPGGESYFLPPEKLIAGNPRQTVQVHYTDASGQFCAGVWHSDVGKWRISYTEEEYCHLLEGISIITDESGQVSRVTAGDRFVVPRGFVGTWEVVESTRKLFVIYEPGDAPRGSDFSRDNRG